MSLQFKRLPNVFPDQELYGCAAGGWSYIISYTTGLGYCCSRSDTTTNLPTTIIIEGNFDSLPACKAACEAEHRRLLS